MKKFNVRVMTPFGVMMVKQINATDVDTARRLARGKYGQGNVYAVSRIV